MFAHLLVSPGWKDDLTTKGTKYTKEIVIVGMPITAFLRRHSITRLAPNYELEEARPMIEASSPHSGDPL